MSTEFTKEFISEARATITEPGVERYICVPVQLEMLDEIERLQSRIAELEAAQRWRVFDWERKENQPDHMQVCLILTTDNEMYSAMFLSDNCWTGLCRDFGRDEVAYWMQSPEPPEVKE